MTAVTKQQTKKRTFRACIFYTGKYANKTGCIFVKAYSKEEAKSFTEEIIHESLKKQGITDSTFKLEITPSSRGEIDFYTQNRGIANYSGIVN